ncbi:hypothetical protein JCM19039_2475 [Geomicrobium sp. JCM 19039]|nr:hypothetical protein JCM19039_2475 [Geomicrobium sp. JCM 19039]
MHFTEGKWRDYERFMKKTPGFDRGIGIKSDHSVSCDKRPVKEKLTVPKHKSDEYR